MHIRKGCVYDFSFFDMNEKPTSPNKTQKKSSFVWKLYSIMGRADQDLSESILTLLLRYALFKKIEF